jgi:hypothetical protein
MLITNTARLQIAPAMQYGHHFFPRRISLKYHADVAASIPAFPAAINGTNGFVCARSAVPNAAMGTFMAKLATAIGPSGAPNLYAISEEFAASEWNPVIGGSGRWCTIPV